MALARGNEVGQVLVKAHNLGIYIGLIADVRIRLGWWSVLCIAPIQQNRRVGCAHNAVHMLNESFLCCKCPRIIHLIH